MGGVEQSMLLCRPTRSVESGGSTPSYDVVVTSVSRSEGSDLSVSDGVNVDPMSWLIGSLVQRAGVAITSYVERGLRAAGYDVSPARAGNVMRNITREGSTIVGIAKSAGVSKQAISRQAEGLHRLGYVDIEASDVDRRTRIVKPTDFGLRSREVVTHLYEDIEAEIERRVGAEDLAAFRRVVNALQDIGAEA